MKIHNTSPQKRSVLGETPDVSFNTNHPHFKSPGFEEEGFGYVLEEIGELSQEESKLVKFFTLMFEIGILMIPIQIIIYDDVKPYEISLILYLQKTFNIAVQDSLTAYIYKLILSMSSIKFLSSLNIFIYFFVDTLVSFKVCLLLGSCSYVVYALKLIIHDSRPFWLDPNILGVRCKTSFGAPTLDVFSGMFYFNFLIFNVGKRHMLCQLDSNGKSLLIATKYLAIGFVGLNLLTGFIHVLYGENFIYQVVFSIFFVYIYLRIIITFDELIYYYAKYARLKERTSRKVSIYLFFTVLVLSILSLILYSITTIDLHIPLVWSENISVNCPKDLASNEISTKNTLLESCSIFQVMGAAFGLYIVLVNIKNRHWNYTGYWNRFCKGTIGFCLNMGILYLQNFVWCKSLATEYVLSCILFFSSGIFSYGILPVIFDRFGFNSQAEKTENQNVAIPEYQKI